MAGKPLSLALYGAVAGAAEPLAPLWLGHRARRGREDPARWTERLGRPGLARPWGRGLAWLHGVSVGESLSLLPLAQRLRDARPQTPLLITSGTRASAEVLAGRLPAGAVHQYAPVDTPGAAARFLDHWRPNLAVFVESELWPNLILGARARGTRLALISARLSEASAQGWAWAPAAARAVLGAFDLILARDAAAARRLTAAGARVDGLADLKFGAPPLPVDDMALTLARLGLGERPMILAASTHPGEDELILSAFAAIRGHADPRLIIAPRHPARGEAIETLGRAAGLSVGRRSAGAALGGAVVHVADTVGELGLWYRLAALAVVGGSLAAKGAGGHNPLEPARLACPFITGPHVPAWPIYRELAAAGATALVQPPDLRDWFGRALGGDAALTTMAERARAFVAGGDAAAGEAADRILDLLPA